MHGNTTCLIAKTLAASSREYDDRAATIDKSRYSSFLLKPKAVEPETILKDPVGEDRAG
jgi:hypothetical protein